METYRQELRRDVESWRLADDTEWIESVARTATSGNGVVLHGDPGAGQDEFAWRVADRLAPRRGLFELACPPDPATSTTLAALTASRPAPGRVLLIPDIALFTGPEVDVVARLVHRHRATVVAIAADPHGSPGAPLAQLLQLERIRIRALSTIDGTQYLENGLDGPLSDRAAFAIWDSGAGNRIMMRMIAEDWRESDHLVAEDGVWVVRSDTPPVGQRLFQYWQQWLEVQEPAVRDVFELLALARELPLNTVLRICESDAVDEVHRLGYLRLRDSAGREASLRGMINARTIADQVPPGRSRLLLDRAAGPDDGSGLRRPAGLVPWLLRCGLPIEPELIIEAAEHLLTYTSPADALDMLNMVPHDVEPERVSALRMAALLAAGQFVDLWTLVDNLRLSPPCADAPTTEPATGSGRSGGGGGSATARATDLVAASLRGDSRSVLGAARHEPGLPVALRWLWQQAAHEALVLTGSVREGLQADRELLHVLRQSDTAPFLVQRVSLGLFEMEAAAGEWNRAAATLTGGRNAESGAPGPGKTGALYSAVAHVMLGDYAAAADILQHEIPQLRVVGRHELLPLGHALHAVSLVRTQRRTEALAALAAVELPPMDGSGGWRLTWAATYFSAQAMAYLGREDAAIGQLMAFAERDRELGNYSQELLTLSAAAQWGHEPALGLLAVAAEHSDGRFAEACTWVTRGLRGGDPEELEYGVLLARAIGQHFFAGFAQQRLEALHGPCPKAVDAARKAEAEDRSSGVVRAPRPGMRDLTRRQRDIVQQVLEGQSNGDIARSLGVSVRTVESHLYQAYSKLNIKNRAELRAVLAGSSPVPPGA